MRVLLIDDDLAAAEDLKFLLHANASITWAHGTRDAIKVLRNGCDPEAIILDLCLPCELTQSELEEGLYALGLLKTWLAPDLPVIVLSRVKREDAEILCLRRGATAYLEKPCKIDDLLRLLEGCT